MLKLFWLFCSEQKRRLKAEQKAKEKSLKEDAKKIAPVIFKNLNSKKNEIKERKEEDISPNVNNFAR